MMRPIGVVLACVAALLPAATLANPLSLVAADVNDSAPSKISVELYFEALCPYCHQVRFLLLTFPLHPRV